MKHYGYEKELIEKGYTEAQLKEMSALLNIQMHGDHDNWGPCCPGCSQFGHATKGCGLYCLKHKPKPLNPPSK